MADGHETYKMDGKCSVVGQEEMGWGGFCDSVIEMLVWLKSGRKFLLSRCMFCNELPVYRVLTNKK